MTDAEIASTIRKMSDHELHSSAVRTSEKERKITLALLRHLNEIERRHLYSKFNVSSLYSYCRQELKFDEGGAGRRVSAARLLKEIPVIEEKILSGAISLTAVAQAGIFFRKEAKFGNAFSLESKREVISQLDDKSTREVDRFLLTKSDQPEIHFKEKITPKPEAITEVRLHLDEETIIALNRLKEIWSHATPRASLADIVKRTATEAVEKFDPIKKFQRADVRSRKKIGSESPNDSLDKHSIRSRSAGSKTHATGSSTSAQKSPLTKAEIKRAVWKRDDAKCTFEDPRSGERCGSKHFIEEDHIQPKAAGGVYSVENIRLRCRAHNQRHAINFYGMRKLEMHLRQT